MKEKFKKYKSLSLSDKIFYGIVDIVMLALFALVIIPILYVVSSSVSDSNALLQGKVTLLPVGFSLEGYKAVFENSRIMTGFANSVFYTVLGTVLAVALTVMCAYPLSRKDLVGRNALMMIITFTMLFSGGLIPGYILIRDLGLMNTRASMILPACLAPYNIIIARSFFTTSIPDELLEASQIDGCSNFKFILSIVLPLSKAIIAVLALYYGVGFWNAWFNAYLYLSDVDKYPLQLVLKEIIFGNSTAMSAASSGSEVVGLDALSESIKYACIMVACIPVWLIYPLIQKYFVKGVMIGSIKG